MSSTPRTRAFIAWLLFFTADDRAPYGKVVAALDGAKQAGAEGLGIMTAPP